MLDSTFVQTIAGLERAATQKLKVAGREILIHDGNILLDELVEKPAPALLTVHTLTGLRDYVKENRDALVLGDVAVHVVSPTRVDVIGATDDATEQRFTHLRAESYNRFEAVKGFSFGQYTTSETMIIALMALFEVSPDREALLQLLSNVEQVAGRTDEDDGISQVATVRHGISMKQERTVPNPVTLVPHRTFVEVDQPASQFVFRMKASREGEQAGAALFEADGGAWRDTATAAIRAWLVEELPEGVAVLA